MIERQKKLKIRAEHMKSQKKKSENVQPNFLHPALWCAQEGATHTHCGADASFLMRISKASSRLRKDSTEVNSAGVRISFSKTSPG